MMAPVLMRMTGRQRVTYGLLVILFLPGGFVARAESVVLQTDNFRYEISPDGRSAALVDLRDERNYAAQEPSPCGVLVESDQRHNASAAVLRGDLLELSFAGTETRAFVRVQRQPGWLVFELERLSDARDVQELIFPHVTLSIQGRKVAVQAGCVSSDRFTAGCQTLNATTESRVQIAGREVTLIGQSYKRFGLMGSRVALFGAPKERVLDVIEAMEEAEPKVPHRTLDGVWARRSPDVRTSYLFIDMTEKNADQIIDIAKELHFRYILIYANTWATTLGSYEINRTAYPHGMDGLRAVADKAHAAGLKVGIHCLTGFVNKRDPLVTPRPDPRLAKDGRVTLATGIGQRDRFIATVESPADFPSDIGYGLERQGFDVQIDDEIITYRTLSTERPYGLKSCIRGAHGTRPATHRPGTVVWHLTQRYSNYLADVETDLPLQIARRYAEVINKCQVDMIYFDGAGSNIAFGRQWAWHYVPQIPLLSAQLWQREVRVGGSCNGPLYWHLQSFKTCNDFVEIGVKRFLDNNKLRAALGVQANFIPADLGWWGLHSWAPHRRATTPDEIEYVCQKALGFDTCWSLETTLRKLQNCGRWPDIKERIAQYEQLRLGGEFGDRIKAAIRQPGAEFKLIGDSRQGYHMAPVRYGPPHLALDEASSSWSIANNLGPQPLRFRLYALPMLSPYEAPDNRVLLDQTGITSYAKTRAHAQCTTSLRGSDERTPDGGAAVAFHARSNLATAAGWAEHRADLLHPGRKTGPPALIEGLPEPTQVASNWSRPLGVWVHGDGQGEVLNIQLRSANGGYRDHYIDVNFTGWKYFELTRPEADRVFEFDAGYSRKHAVRHFQYDRIAFVFLRYNSIPPKADVRCLVGPIKALREHWLPLENPAITVGGRKIVFPCRVETEQYLEFDGQGEARLFDREGVELARVAPQGDVPTIKAGRNQITYSSDPASDHSQRADITVIRVGKPL